MNVNSFDQSDHKEPDMPGHSPINKSPFSNLKGFKVAHLNITILVKHLDEQNIEIAGYDILRRVRIRLGILMIKVNIHHG